MDSRGRRRALETYDLGVGFFGFFAVAFVIISVVFQIIGRDAVWASVSAFAAIIIAALIYLFRRRFVARTAAGGAGPEDHAD